MASEWNRLGSFQTSFAKKPATEIESMRYGDDDFLRANFPLLPSSAVANMMP
jgi:hypothetical protein